MQDSSSRTLQRLPVNPRRRKVAPEDRKRVVRACNGCNVRRVKCSGDQPCQQCRTGLRDCVYPAEPPLKGNSLKEELDRLRKKCDKLERCLHAAVPDESARNDLLSGLDCVDTPPSVSTHSEPSGLAENEAAEGRVLLDPDGNGRYLGETSGATFLDLLKHFMATLVPLAFVPEDGSTFVASVGRYQTFDSRPLLDLDVDPFWLPMRTEMIMMLAELRYHVQDGNGDFPSGGIYYWGDLNHMPEAISLAISQSEAVASDRYRYLAFNHVSFAMAAQILNQSLLQGEIHAGDAYFQRARMLLGNPLDTVRFTLRDVPVLALMAFYLIEINRRDAAYLYTSLAVHIAITHGAFRYCANEPSRRIFWTLYILDRWLSCLMGRPPTLADEAIRLAPPTDDPSMPSAAGLRAHVQLARISGFIVCETFRIAPKNPSPNPARPDVDKPLKMLQEWLSNLPPSLQMSRSHFSEDPACCNLHMAHNQLVIIITRSSFLMVVKRAVAERYMKACSWSLEQEPQYKHIEACAEAAYHNMHLAQWVMRLYSTRRLLQAGLHFVFNAAVILILNRVLRDYSSAAEEIDFAISVFTEESRTGTNYQRDCLQVLKDLKVLIDRFLNLQRSPSVPQVYSNDQPSPDPDLFNATVDSHFNIAHGRQYLPNGGENVYQELMAWMQHDNAQPHSTFRM